MRTFAEPCCGDGALVRHLESFGLRCVYAGDISTGQDALDLTPADISGAPIITNPPFSRKSQPLLRRLIAHFLRIASAVWLLLPADFASNQWFAPFLSQCSDIVAFGRVRWFAGTKGNSTDNFAWYRFDALRRAPPSMEQTCANSISNPSFTSSSPTSRNGIRRFWDLEDSLLEKLDEGATLKDAAAALSDAGCEVTALLKTRSLTDTAALHRICKTAKAFPPDTRRPMSRGNCTMRPRLPRC